MQGTRRIWGNYPPGDAQQSPFFNRGRARIGVEIILETRELKKYSKTRLNSARTRTLMSRAKLTFF
jgi:hypothetical protein